MGKGIKNNGGTIRVRIRGGEVDTVKKKWPHLRIEGHDVIVPNKDMERQVMKGLGKL